MNSLVLLLACLIGGVNLNERHHNKIVYARPGSVIKVELPVDFGSQHSWFIAKGKNKNVLVMEEKYLSNTVKYTPGSKSMPVNKLFILKVVTRERPKVFDLNFVHKKAGEVDSKANKRVNFMIKTVCPCGDRCVCQACVCE